MANNEKKEPDIFSGNSSEEEKLPGEEYKPKPIIINGEYYDGFEPPEIYGDSGGEQTVVGGKKLNKEEIDEIYSDLFWKEKEQSEEVRKKMAGEIKEHFKKGEKLEREIEKNLKKLKL